MAMIEDHAVISVGRDLRRPECVLGAPNGDVYVSDWRGGVSVLRADGRQEAWLAVDAPIELKPNGFTFLADRGFLIANLGPDGGLWTLGLDGTVEAFLLEVGNVALPPANFVWLDEEDRLWASFSTRHEPRQAAWRNDVRDGFVVVIDKTGARIACDGLHYANEVRTHPDGAWLYMVETFGQRLVRAPISAGGRLGPCETIADFDAGFFPDGIAFDDEGAVWVTSLLSNQLIRIMPDGAQEIVFAEAATAGYARTAQQRLDANRMPPDQLGPMPGSRFQHVTSIGFGGADGRTAWLGSLHAEHIFRFRSPVAGARAPYQRLVLP